MTDTVGSIVTENFAADAPDELKTEAGRRLNAATKQSREEIYRGRTPSMNFLIGSGALALLYPWHHLGVAGEFEDEDE